MIGLRSLGGQELSYNSPLRLIFLFDAIDPRNVWHRDFYETLVRDMVSLLDSDPSQINGIHVDLRGGPKHEVGVSICSFREAAKIYETSGQVSQRMEFMKARVVAGSASVGKAFLDRLQPWIYRQFNGIAELAEMTAIQHRLQRRADQELSVVGDFVNDPGGMEDVRRIVECLQILHGGHLPGVRKSNLYDAIAALKVGKCIHRTRSRRSVTAVRKTDSTKASTCSHFQSPWRRDSNRYAANTKARLGTGYPKFRWQER